MNLSSVYADSAISLGQYYVQAFNGSYNADTDVITFNSRYTLSGVGFNLPDSIDYYTFVSNVDNIYLEYYASLTPSGYSGITLMNGDSIQIYSNSSQSVDLKIMCNAANVSSMPVPFILSDNVTLYLGDAPAPIPPTKSSYSIQNGWLTVIDLGNSGASYNYNLSTMFNVNSGLISQDWTETSQLYWFSNTLPSAGDSYENIGTLIEWDRGEPRNLFGQTKYGVYNLSGISTGRYLYILNPFYRAIADSEHPTVINYPVTVDGLLEGQQAYIYEVTATATVTGIVNAITTTTVDGVSTITNWGTTSGGSISSDVTNTFVNSDTDTSTIQTAGGGNSNESAQTINDYLQQIQNVLDSFVTQVLGLLTAPISHIKQLISVGSDFMSTLGGLFSWLPAPVMSVIVSALIVMVVIGVFKMFL